MWYQINVARSAPAQHIFRTDENSILSAAEAKNIAKELEKIYPAPEYEITVSRVALQGVQIYSSLETK